MLIVARVMRLIVAGKPLVRDCFYRLFRIGSGLGIFIREEKRWGGVQGAGDPLPLGVRWGIVVDYGGQAGVGLVSVGLF